MKPSILMSVLIKHFGPYAAVRVVKNANVSFEQCYFHCFSKEGK